MKIPFASELPHPLRRAGRRLVHPSLRARLAANIEHLAHAQFRLNPRFKASRRRLEELRGKHSGECCVILGNGPSLAALDLARLGGTAAFCLNRGYLKWREAGLVPTYAVAVNDLIIEQFHADLSTIGCPLFVPWRHHDLFAASDAPVFVEIRWHRRFFSDVTRGLWPGATVTFAAMQLAYHMGFETVILVGVDHRFTQGGAPNEEIVQRTDDPDHFTPDYFGKDTRWNLPDLETSALAYRMARAAFERSGRRIVDATEGGALDVFPKMPLGKALAEYCSPDR